jgi:periplasmic protein TonB
MPSDAAINLAYPLRAAEARLSGLVEINCAVHIDGTLDDCAVVSETPPGEGFGVQALGLADFMLMDPLKCDGRPVDGARVTVPIAFTPH